MRRKQMMRGSWRLPRMNPIDSTYGTKRLSNADRSVEDCSIEISSFAGAGPKQIPTRLKVAQRA